MGGQKGVAEQARRSEKAFLRVPGLRERRLHLENAVNRTNGHASGFFVIADTIHTYILVYHIDTIARGDGADRAFRFAGSAVGAFIGNTVCHGVSGLKWIKKPHNESAPASL
jgi:hypothetical protein